MMETGVAGGPWAGRDPVRQCLTIAGSDSGGGAGIQADLKTFQACGVFGMSVITSITAQNTREVRLAHGLPPSVVRAQIETVFDDFDVASAKTGMLHTPELVEEVAGFWRGLQRAPALVVDPVMVAKGGHPLLSEEAISVVRSRLLPLAAVVTPNRHEAELLSGTPITGRASILEAGRAILASGCGAVLIKGGHLEGDGLDPAIATDFLITAEGVAEYSAPRESTSSTHGTGCTYSAAIAAWLGRGCALHDAVAHAKVYVSGAIRHGLRIGGGHGPTNHQYFLRDPATLHA